MHLFNAESLDERWYAAGIDGGANINCDEMQIGQRKKIVSDWNALEKVSREIEKATNARLRGDQFLHRHVRKG